MAFSDDLLDDAAPIWDAQKEHPFVRELADGSLDPDAFRRWVEQDYRYLLDYARVFAMAGVRARDEATMTHLLGIAHTTLDHEMDLHREFAADCGLTPADLEAVEKTPTCVAYTNYLLRIAHEGSLAEISAAIYPCGQGYLDVADHMAELATEDHLHPVHREVHQRRLSGGGGMDARVRRPLCRGVPRRARRDARSVHPERPARSRVLGDGVHPGVVASLILSDGSTQTPNADEPLHGRSIPELDPRDSSLREYERRRATEDRNGSLSCPPVRRRRGTPHRDRGVPGPRWCRGFPPAGD